MNNGKLTMANYLTKTCQASDKNFKCKTTIGKKLATQVFMQ